MKGQTRQRRWKPAAAAAAAAASLAAGIAILATPATADDPTKTCPKNSICVWEDGGYQTPVRWWVSTAKDLNYSDNHYFGPERARLNDTISSVWNNSSRWVKFFKNSNASGNTLCVSPHTKHWDLTLVQRAPDANLENDWSNQISGHFTSGYTEPNEAPPGCNKELY